MSKKLKLQLKDFKDEWGGLKAGFSNKSQKNFLALVLALVSLPVIVALARTTALFLGNAQVATVRMYFNPSTQTLPPNASSRLMLDSGSSRIGFVAATVDFNTTKAQLTGEVTTNSRLGRVIRVTDRATANSTGKVEIVLGLNPSQRSNAPSGVFEIASLPFTSVVTSQQSMVLNIRTPQVVDMSENNLNVNITAGNMTLNPPGSGGNTPTPTRVSTPTPAATSSPRPTNTPTPRATNSPTPTLSSGGSTSQVTIVANADTYVSSEYPNNNYGGSSRLLTVNTPSRITYMKFDLTQLANTDVRNAELQVRVYNASTKTQRIKQVSNTSWSESGLTYNNRPSLGSQIGAISGTVFNQWKYINITTFVNQNKGRVVTLAIDTAESDKLELYSRSSSLNGPRIVVNSGSGGTSTATPTTAPTASLVSNLKVASGKSYQIVTYTQGMREYIDRSYTVRNPAPTGSQYTYIRTANDDKSRTDTNFLTFTLSSDANVYVAYDRRVSRPSWLVDGWQDTGQVLETTDVPLRLYRRRFSRGTVTLGANRGGSTGSMYVVLINE